MTHVLSDFCKHCWKKHCFHVVCKQRTNNYLTIMWQRSAVVKNSGNYHLTLVFLRCLSAHEFTACNFECLLLLTLTSTSTAVFRENKQWWTLFMVPAQQQATEHIHNKNAWWRTWTISQLKSHFNVNMTPNDCTCCLCRDEILCS